MTKGTYPIQQKVLLKAINQQQDQPAIETLSDVAQIDPKTAQVVLDGARVSQTLFNTLALRARVNPHELIAGQNSEEHQAYRVEMLAKSPEDNSFYAYQLSPSRSLLEIKSFKHISGTQVGLKSLPGRLNNILYSVHDPADHGVERVTQELNVIGEFVDEYLKSSNAPTISFSASIRDFTEPSSRLPAVNVLQQFQSLKKKNWRTYVGYVSTELRIGEWNRYEDSDEFDEGAIEDRRQIENLVMFFSPREADALEFSYPKVLQRNWDDLV